ncbi:protein GENOMES UNCOUPLED 4 [Tasmannia lanceolata]|uniref:protein GENOMES UNCOUPLED 4 n=1 Tax=Tasmannia lanceolata TaxID=3420 RepID=UPI0040643E40
MATTSLQSLHHSLIKRHHLVPPPDSSLSSVFLKPTFPSLSHKLSSTFTPSTPTTSSTTSPTPTTSPTISFHLLEQHLSSQNFRLADEETRRLLIALAGEAALKRGYVFFSEVQFISHSDFQTIDGLWRQYSNNKFGYSVQKKIWEKVGKDFTRFFMKVRWMKKLDTEIEQFNYRAFPDEFLWEMGDDTPEGHLPLTNALRGTQLLNSILSNPAFQSMDEEKEEEKGVEMSLEELRQSPKPISKMSFKTDYSF